MLLIVEDEVISRKALSHLLRLHGYETRAAESGEQALSLICRGEVPEAAVVDVNLPGMTGVEFIRRLHQSHPQVPCVMMSSDETNFDSSRFPQSRPAFRKPFDVNRLLTWIEGLPGQARPFNQV